MSQDLATENRRLRQELSQLLKLAQENQQILQRYQAFDLQFIGASGFQDLIDVMFVRFAKEADLSIVTLSLLDPEYDVRRILAELDIRFTNLPNLIFLNEEMELGELADRLYKPVLGPYAEHLHGMFFPEPFTAPASVAAIPLIRHHRLIGCMALGSSNPARFAPDMGTEFLEHMASIVAISLENVINNEKLKHIGLTDPLTGINNRRYVERRLLEEIGRARRHRHALSCLYIDIDHFKRINDGIGHQAGDEVLRMVSGRIKAELRLSDALGRFGGEEFVVVLIDAGAEEAKVVAERIRQSVAETPLTLSSGKTLEVTVSIGLATLGEKSDDFHTGAGSSKSTSSSSSSSVEAASKHFLARADKALYQAKQNGRNKVVAAV
jgi:two-component system, cell cycle response regulator